MSDRFYLTRAGVESLAKRYEAVNATVEAAERLIMNATPTDILNRCHVSSHIMGDLERAKDQLKAIGPLATFCEIAAQPATCGGCGAKACANPARDCGVTSKAGGETPCDANGLAVYVRGRRIDAPPHRDAYANWAASSFAGVDLAGETPESKPGAAVADTVEKIAADIVHWWRANDPHNKGTIGDLVARLEVVLPKAAEPKPEPASHPDVIAQTAVDGDAQRRHGRQARLIVSGVEVVEGLSDAYRESSTALQDRLRWSTNGKALRKLRDALAEFTTDDVGPVAVETEADRRIAQLEKERDEWKRCYEETDRLRRYDAERSTRTKAEKAEQAERFTDRIRTLEDALSDVEKGAKMTADRLAEMEESHASAVQALAYCIKGFAILKAAVDAYKPGESSWSRVQIAAAPLLVHPDTAAAVAQVKSKVKAIQDDANDMVIRSPFESEMRTIALRLRANVANLA